MKKLIFLGLTLLLFIGVLSAFTSCKNNNCQHEWSEEVVSSEATCSRSGVSHIYCSKCGESQRIVIPKLPHTYSEDWEIDSLHHWHKATCEHSDEISVKEPHDMQDGVCTVCHMATVSIGLEYRGNLGGVTYRVIGIGTTLDANVIVARYYKDYEIVAVDDNAFEKVKGLKSVTLQMYIKSIGDRAFASNDELTFIEFTSKLEYLGAEVIDDCPAFEKIVYRGTVEEWNKLPKAENWKGNAKNFIVDCSNGDLQY